ncbi:MAG: glycosyltransferase [Bacteroidota bacterium]
MLWLLLPLVLYAFYLWTVTAFALRQPSASEGRPPGAPVRVLVPMRNEASNIEQCIRGLCSQQLWRNADVELLVIDDHSTDDSLQLADSALQSCPFPAQVLQLPEAFVGKKAALAYAILQQPEDAIILTTDADCTHPGNWIRTMASSFDAHTQVVCAPVRLVGNSVFAQWQELEFAGLMALTAGHIRMGFPSLANGANFSFRKAAYSAVEGYNAAREVASGDDMLLMHKIATQFGTDTVRFVDAPTATVYTPAEPTLRTFWHQRLRWVSKADAYTSFSTVVSQTLAWLGGSLPVIYSLLVVLVQLPLWLIGLAWTLKLLAELPLLVHGAWRYGRKKTLLWLPILQPVQAVYTLLIGPAGVLTRHYTWKDRRTR